MKEVTFKTTLAAIYFEVDVKYVVEGRVTDTETLQDVTIEGLEAQYKAAWASMEDLFAYEDRVPKYSVELDGKVRKYTVETVEDKLF